MARKLPGHVEPAAQGGEVVCMIHISARQTHPHRFHQAGAKKADQQFENGILLPSKLGQHARTDPQIMNHREHVDEAATKRFFRSVVLSETFDLGEDLQLTSRRGDHADHAAGPQAFAAVFEHAFAATPREAGTRRHGGNPISLGGRDGRVVIPIADALPFAERSADHEPRSRA